MTTRNDEGRSLEECEDWEQDHARKRDLETMPFDVVMIRQEAVASGARRVKRELIKAGYAHQMSLYGASYNVERDEFTARRIEILSDEPFAQRSLQMVYDAFTLIIPPWRYSLWALSSITGKLSLKGGYN